MTSTTKLHDYNPGIPASGLFWTVPVPTEAVRIHLASGRAALRVARRRISDFGNLLHALRGDPSEPAEVSFDVRWGDVIQRLDLRDEDVGFEGHFVENHAAIEWSARQEGFEFVSDPMDTSQTVFAVIGRERNGAFFR